MRRRSPAPGSGIGPVTDRYVAGKEPGLIVSTDPAPGTQVPRDYAGQRRGVRLRPRARGAPALAGLLEATATAVAEQGGFGLSVRSQRCRTVTPGSAG